MSPGIQPRDVVVRENARERVRVVSLHDCAFCGENGGCDSMGTIGSGHASDRGARKGIYGDVWMVSKSHNPGRATLRLGGLLRIVRLHWRSTCQRLIPWHARGSPDSVDEVMGYGYYNCCHIHDYITLVGDTSGRCAGEQAMEFERAMM